MGALLSRFSLYVSYFFNVVDAHSLHAPFVYDLYTNAIKGKVKPDGQIEAIRKQLLQSDEAISYYTYGKSSALHIKSRNRIASIAKYGISKLSNSCMFARLIQYMNCYSILELGTSLGINTAYLALANKNAQIYTFEGHDQLVKIAQSNFEQLGMHNVHVKKGNINDTLPVFLNDVDQLDFILLDANHTKYATIDYFNMLLTTAHENTVMVIDDIRWSSEMYEAWKEITANKWVRLSLDLMDVGILFFKNGMTKQHYALKK